MGHHARNPGGGPRAGHPRSLIQRMSPFTCAPTCCTPSATCTRLHVPGGGPQAAVLIEVAAGEAGHAEVVGVLDRGPRVVDPRPVGGRHRSRERLVLGIGHIGETAAPRGTRADSTRSRWRGSCRLVARRARAARRCSRRPRRTRCSSRAIIGLVSRTGEMRPEGGAHSLAELEGLAIGGQPAVHGHGVLGQEADQLAGGALRPEVAGPAVPELLRRDAQQLDGWRRQRSPPTRPLEPESITSTSSGLLATTASSTSPRNRAPSLTGITTETPRMPLPPLEYVEVLVALDPARGETGHEPLRRRYAGQQPLGREERGAPVGVGHPVVARSTPNSAAYQKPCS